MAKFTSLERLKNHIRSYEEALCFYNEPGQDAPIFEPNPKDVQDLIEKYEVLSKALISIKACLPQIEGHEMQRIASTALKEVGK